MRKINLTIPGFDWLGWRRESCDKPQTNVNVDQYILNLSHCLTPALSCHTISYAEGDAAVITYDDSNLQKHKVTPKEVDQVLDSRNLSTRIFDLAPARNGNERAMFVGLTFRGRLLEVGVEAVDDTEDHVFHAMNATKQYR